MTGNDSLQLICTAQKPRHASREDTHLFASIWHYAHKRAQLNLHQPQNLDQLDLFPKGTPFIALNLVPPGNIIILDKNAKVSFFRTFVVKL